MESETQFDLNHNLELWRQSLAQSPSFQPDNLDELEVHLRDSVSTLEGKGLSTEEAFLIATRRLGQPAALHNEFGKVNSHAVWSFRWAWMSIGAFLFLCFNSLRGVVVFATMEFGKLFDSNAHVLGFLSMAASSTLFGALILLLRRMTDPNLKRRGEFITRSILNRPVAFTVGLAIFGMGLFASSTVGSWLFWRGAIIPQQGELFRIVTSWSVLPVTVAELLLLPMATVYLYRRQLKSYPTQA